MYNETLIGIMCLHCGKLVSERASNEIRLPKDVAKKHGWHHTATKRQEKNGVFTNWKCNVCHEAGH